MEEARTLEEAKSDIDRQVDDVVRYLCSRGDTMHLKDEVADRTRRILHALSVTGWVVLGKEQV